MTHHVPRNSKRLTQIIAAAVALSFAFAVPATAGSSYKSDISVSNWARKVGLRLDRKMEYPSRAATQMNAGISVVHLDVAADGTVEDIKLARSSGFTLLDAASMKTAKKLGKLPKLPASLRAKDVTVALNMRYLLEHPNARPSARSSRLRRIFEGETEIEDIANKGGSVVATVSILTPKD